MPNSKPPRVDPAEYGYCQLVCEPKRFPIDDTEPDRFMHATAGTIHLTDDVGELGEEVGTFEVTVMDVESAVNERASVFELFDTTAATLRYYQALYASDDGDLKDSVMRAVWGEQRYAPNVLILDRLIIGVEHRGHGLGLAALKALCENFRTGIGFIAMTPYPLQYEGAARSPDEFQKNVRELDLQRWAALPEKTAFSRLRKYYEKLGFTRVPRTNYMVRAADIPFKQLT